MSECYRCGEVMDHKRMSYVEGEDMVEETVRVYTTGVFLPGVGGNDLVKNVVCEMVEAIEGEYSSNIGLEDAKDKLPENLSEIHHPSQMTADEIISAVSNRDYTMKTYEKSDKPPKKDMDRNDYVGYIPVGVEVRVNRRGLICDGCLQDSDRIIW